MLDLPVELSCLKKGLRHQRLTLNLNAASLNINSKANTAVNIMFNISNALLYSGGWLWYFIASVIVLIMISTKMAYSNGCDVTNHHTLYWIRCLGIYLQEQICYKHLDSHTINIKRTRPLKHKHCYLGLWKQQCMLCVEK